MVFKEEWSPFSDENKANIPRQEFFVPKLFVYTIKRMTFVRYLNLMTSITVYTVYT